jgi:tryptophan synthase beta subunit
MTCQGLGQNKFGILFGFEEFDDDIDVALRGVEAFGYRRERRRKS